MGCPPEVGVNVREPGRVVGVWVGGESYGPADPYCHCPPLEGVVPAASLTAVGAVQYASLCKGVRRSPNIWTFGVGTTDCDRGYHHGQNRACGQRRQPLSLFSVAVPGRETRPPRRLGLFGGCVGCGWCFLCWGRSSAVTHSSRRLLI